LPDPEPYLSHFSLYQHEAYQKNFALGHTRLLEDYALTFQVDFAALQQLNLVRFSERLKEQITPLLQVATNAGFPAGWRYRS
ncbi:MAG: hypothetical protein KDC54_22805, partial [Lewinella sp.]|nr:hypothetical protein [Lewinella sp.]